MNNKFVYVNQPYVLTLETKIDLNNVSSYAILAEKPNGSIVSYPASIYRHTKLRYVITPTQNDQTGDWKFQALANTSNGSTPGKTVIIAVLPRYSPAPLNNP